jgi:uncharacterized protein
MKATFVTGVGSQLYGTATAKSDKDFKGFGFEDIDQIIGLRNFEQQEYSNHEPDGPTKMEGTCYSIRRYLQLCLKGNPTVIEIAFADKAHWMLDTPVGQEICDYVRKNFLTKHLFKPYSAYHMAQMRKLQSMERTGKRAEEVKKFGLDTKFAGHAYRLARQCAIVMREGTLRPTLDPDDKIMCLDIRAGKYNKEEVLAILKTVDEDMYSAYKVTTLPEAPNFNKANDFMVDVYRRYLNGTFDSQLGTEYNPFT